MEALWSKPALSATPSTLLRAKTTMADRPRQQRHLSALPLALNTKLALQRTFLALSSAPLQTSADLLQQAVLSRCQSCYRCCCSQQAPRASGRRGEADALAATVFVGTNLWLTAAY